MTGFLNGTKILIHDNTYKKIEELSTNDKLMSHNKNKHLQLLNIDKFESYESPYTIEKDTISVCTYALTLCLII